MIVEKWFHWKFTMLGLHGHFVEPGSRDQLLTFLGLDVDGVAQSIRNFIGEKDSVSV